MFRFIYNVVQTVLISMWYTIMTIITGKMVKVSIYHFDSKKDDNTLFNVCNDKFKKTNYASNVSSECKKTIINNFIEHLVKDENFHNPLSDIEFPIFDGKEIIGNDSYLNVIQTSLDDFIKQDIVNNSLLLKK